MASVYFFLSLVALIFGLLGFLIHAFYFKSAQAEELSDEIERLSLALEEKKREARDAQDEIVKAGTLLHSLEQQVRHRNDEMERLQRMSERQSEEINSLQKDAEVLRAMMAMPSTGQSDSAAEPASAAPATVAAVAHKATGTNSSGSADRERPPAWRENLNNILNILDTMEREIER